MQLSDNRNHSQPAIDARHERDSFLAHTNGLAHQKLVQQLYRLQDFYNQELDTIPFRLNHTKPHHCSHNHNCFLKAPAAVHRLCSAQALEDICRDQSHSVVMPKVDRPERYTTWIPTHGFHKMDLDEPYMPYFGETVEHMQKSQKVFEKLLLNLRHTSDDLPSEGEPDEQYDFLPGLPEEEDPRKPILPGQRLRAAQRRAISVVVERYGTGSAVWDALTCALDYKNVSICKAAYDVGEKRKKEKKERRRIRASKEAYDNGIINVLHMEPAGVKRPQAEAMLCDFPLPKHYMDTVSNNNPFKYFCLGCFQFACNIHQLDEHVTPVKPIQDPTMVRRMEHVEGRNIRPCSMRCYMLSQWRQLPLQQGENSPWSMDEIELLREGLAMCNRDPCTLALIIGSRSCREIRKAINKPEERQWINVLLRAISKPRPLETNLFYEEELGKALQRIDLENETTKGQKGKSHKKKSSEVRAKKTTKQPEAVVENPRYIPCNHTGPCQDNKQCTCVTKQTYCESRCACHAERVISENGKLSIHVDGGCTQRICGCACEEGGCSGIDCACWGTNQFCNPDICKCDCEMMCEPGKPVRVRGCRNVPVAFGRKKKTFVGNSRFGLGLFAGDFFEAGDLVGVYYGGLFGVAETDKALSIGQERNVTYAFDLTDDLTIDALLIGAKVRFINHAGTAEDGKNCECKFQSARGNPYVIIRTTREVRPGREFLFNYKLSHSEGNEWLHDSTND